MLIAIHLQDGVIRTMREEWPSCPFCRVLTHGLNIFKSLVLDFGLHPWKTERKE